MLAGEASSTSTCFLNHERVNRTNMNPAVEAAGVSKVYRVCHEAPRLRGARRTLREDIMAAIGNPMTRIRRRFMKAGAEDSEVENFWALRDVGFQVAPGEVVGIIGRNGAGKSTLLKILSRVTPPTAGRLIIRGRVGSLLEVGTGFHQELTGRENIFMNGSILGMTRREIVRKFDEIVDFSGVEKFLDTPVKRFSSGMQVRLAFAVAAHLEPEVMIVDEVLAVGDAAFQRKCLSKMGDVARSGRTILLVSHDMAAIQSLCSRAILIHCGQVVCDADPVAVVSEYMRLSEESIQIPITERVDRQGSGAGRLVGFQTISANGTPVSQAFMGQPLTMSLAIRHAAPLNLPRIRVIITSELGHRVTTLFNLHVGWQEALEPPESVVRCTVPRIPLTPGRYFFGVELRNGKELMDRIETVGMIDVVPGDVFGTGRAPKPRDGIVYMASQWGLAGAEADGSWSIQDQPCPAANGVEFSGES